MTELEHIRWLGGGTGAGKTTVAGILATAVGVSIYSTDAAIRTHAEKLTMKTGPLYERFRHMTMDERWVGRDPVEMLRTFPWFQGEAFEVLVNDLRALPTDRITLVEGFRVLPQLVVPLLTHPEHAAWLIPTPEFRRAAFDRRTGAEAFWLRTSDPEQAFQNLLARDGMFSAELADAVALERLTTVPLDGSVPAEKIAEMLAGQFGL